MKLWKDYIENLFEVNREVNKIEEQKEETRPDITKTEFQCALKNMKNGKSTEPDQLPIDIRVGLENLKVEKAVCLQTSRDTTDDET
ncbi:hypothetical protein ILUMI_13324 [Ignelater luminosus]|uniref:Uncharacterized protein n=1 Tax=Ignelater luminosus TaxID=2038154 RepID=A0A8K0CUQ1_IGNLU|nr:hypothetical protein ILUMI_13324 [Ignelater luminosus]